MQHSNRSLTQKQIIIFAALSVFGMMALLLGLALIIFAQYHERAYIFLALGVASFIGGIAGLVETGSKVKATLSYGAIALGMMGIIIGLNYLVSRYGPPPNQIHGNIVIVTSLITILAGIVGALLTQPKGGMTAFLSVIMLGVIASLGIVVLIVGTIYLVVLKSQGHAYLLLGTGMVCLISGIICGIFAQSRARATSH